MGLAFGSMSCLFWFCFSWFKEGFVCAVPTVLLVHWSTSLCRSSVNVPFLLLLLLAWTCSVDCGRGSGHVTRLLVEDPGKSNTESWDGVSAFPLQLKPLLTYCHSSGGFRTSNPPPPGWTPLLKEMVQVQWLCIFYHIMLPWPLTCLGWNQGQGVKPGMQPCNADIPGHPAPPQRPPWGGGRWDVLLTLQALIKWIYHLFYLHKFTGLLEKCHCHRGNRQGWSLCLKGSGSPPLLSMMPGSLTWLFVYFWGKNPTRTMKV